MTTAFSLTRHVTDFSAPCGIPAHACLCVALFICHPPYPILPSQRRPPCRDAKSCVSRPLHTPPRIDNPHPPIAISPCETQDFASLLSLPCDIILRKPSFHPNGVRLVETQNFASPVLSTPLHAHEIPIHPSRFPPCETQNFASPVLSITINVCNDSVMINAFSPCETQDFASLLLCGHVVSLLPRRSLTMRQA